MQEEIDKLLEGHPDARNFVLLYTKWCHMIDDLIDDNSTNNNPEYILALCAHAGELYSCNFYRTYHALLYPVDFLINNTYADSVKWERSNEAYKQIASDTLRHTAVDMILLVITILYGREKLRELSPKFREFAHVSQGYKLPEK